MLICGFENNELELFAFAFWSTMRDTSFFASAVSFTGECLKDCRHPPVAVNGSVWLPINIRT